MSVSSLMSSVSPEPVSAVPDTDRMAARFRGGLLGLCLLLGTALAGCSMAPQYVRPEAPITDAWPDEYMPDGTVLAKNGARSVADIGWRDFFTDPHLQRLIESALVNNRDLRVSALNIERARALYQIQRADQIPNLDASGEGSNQSTPRNISTRGERSVSRQYNVSLGMSSYELDFFGRIQSLKDQALEEYFATEEAMKSAQISLVAEVASAYVTLVADREMLNISKDTLDSQRASYEMIKRRHDVGVSSELDLWQAQTSVDTARVNIARYTGQVAQDLTALSLLVGASVSPDMIPAQKLSELRPWQDLPVGLPSSVLLRRPDILQSEHLLKAANANIGAARANFFPRISLTASVGTVSKDLSGLFDAGSGMWSFIPQFSLPIFEGGRNLATLRVSEADKSIAVADYEKAIQSAFREVADALILRDTYEGQLAAQQSLTHASGESYRLSQERYTQGVDSYLNVLDSQRMLFNSQLDLVTVKMSREINLLQLYKALGGGWTEHSVAETSGVKGIPAKTAGNLKE